MQGCQPSISEKAIFLNIFPLSPSLRHQLGMPPPMRTTTVTATMMMSSPTMIVAASNISPAVSGLLAVLLPASSSPTSSASACPVGALEEERGRQERGKRKMNFFKKNFGFVGIANPGKAKIIISLVQDLSLIHI